MRWDNLFTIAQRGDELQNDEYNDASLCWDVEFQYYNFNTSLYTYIPKLQLQLKHKL